MHDTIVDEVRKIRNDYARRFNYDLNAMCADLRREQMLNGAQVVSFCKKPHVDRHTLNGAEADTDKRGD